MALIFLNGTTSSGKTSIARALQDELVRPYCVTGIDDAFAMLPDRLHNNPDGFFFDRDERDHVRLNFGRIGLACLKAHHRSVAAMARSGIDLICDEVILTEELRRDWHEVLSGVRTAFVGVHCSLEELERREIIRGDRVIGQARGQFDIVHLRMQYDIVVNSTNKTPAMLAREIAGLLPASF
ncbi:AAA family ATPase [Erythrobacter sp. NFXS35]|uniref:chloramphenicol phosphotransferase CPT family protein n=1 Tax=Erythrobacter sp. NFXS35 TaxID=2818436 RepID=UPI0032DE2BC9